MLKRKRRRKYASGLMVRLIDIVFILLFGFVAISEVDRMSKVKLAKSDSVSKNRPEQKTVIYISIPADGVYWVENETRRLDTIQEVERYILQKRDQYAEKNIDLDVRIRASHNSAVKYAFPVVRRCQNMNVHVEMDVIRQESST